MCGLDRFRRRRAVGDSFDNLSVLPRSLQWGCPVCQSTHWVDEAKCSCGFRLEYREPLVRHFEAAQHAHKTRNYLAAITHLKKRKSTLPTISASARGWKRSRKESPRSRREGGFRDRTRAETIGRGGAALEAWSKLADPADKSLRAAWTDVMHGFQTPRRSAPAPVDSPYRSPSLRELLRQALEHAADLPDAVDALHHCPPDPPIKLLATFEDDRMKLRWDAPPADGLGPVIFRVLRKRETVPLHAGDGVLVAEVKGTECEDRDVAPGESVGYAVFSHRHESDSISGATAGPLLALADVRHARAETTSREVHLFWKPPLGAIDIRVVRKRGVPPRDSNDGDLIEALRDSAHDRDLEDGRVYHYGIFAIYKPANKPGTRVLRGVFITALPQSPAEPIDTARLHPVPSGGVRVSWLAPKHGQGRRCARRNLWGKSPANGSIPMKLTRSTDIGSPWNPRPRRSTRVRRTQWSFITRR